MFQTVRHWLVIAPGRADVAANACNVDSAALLKTSGSGVAAPGRIRNSRQNAICVRMATASNVAPAFTVEVGLDRREMSPCR
jgi:hypothetical protein